MFDFPDIPKIEYKRTFLISSIFNIEFDYEIKWEEHFEAINKVLKKNFSSNNGQEINIYSSQDNESKELYLGKKNKTIEFKSKDGLNVIALENNVLAIVLHGKSYKSFNSFRAVFEDIDILLKEELSNYEIKRFSERKINIIDFALNNNGAITLKQLLNSVLVGNIDYVPNINYIKQFINNIVFEKEEASLNIKYGLNKVNDSIGQIILDLTMFMDINERSNINHLHNFNIINTELYKAFNWAITDDYKEIMNNYE